MTGGQLGLEETYLDLWRLGCQVEEGLLQTFRQQLDPADEDPQSGSNEFEFLQSITQLMAINLSL